MMLYVHIPFCKKKCGYCDFLSFAGKEGEIDTYVSCLINEINLRSPEHKTELSSIYFGGGTPSLLTPFHLEKIITAIDNSFKIERNCEITLEVNPGAIADTLARSLPVLGINRVSIGLQSADNEELKLLGRIHTFSDFLKTYESIIKSGISNISVDIMTGIPKQSLPSLEKTLRIVTGLRPNHISTYALILEDNTAFSRKYKKFNPPLPDEEKEYKLYRLAIDYLNSHGYERYEVSNYKRENYYSRHNMGYWERIPYLGVGLGASSFYDHVRLKNTEDLLKYKNLLNRDNPKYSDDFFSEVVNLSKLDEIEEFMYLGLRKTEGISIRDFEMIFGDPIDVYFHDTIDYLIKNGFIEKLYGRIYLTDLGIDMSNQVLSRFLIDR